MMKKSLLMLLCLLLALPFVCAAEEAEPTPPVFEWERNAAGHWHVLESGEKADVSAHTPGDDLICTVCRSEVWAFDDGAADVYDYDEHGNIVRYSSFDSEGTLTHEQSTSYTYDENGQLLSSLEFVNGVLFGKNTFALSPEGETVPVSQYTWYDDGNWALNEFDEYGNCVRAVAYYADDSIASETISEYKRGDWGWFYESKNTTYMDEAVFISEYNEYGDRTRVLNSDAGLVWADYTNEYEYRNGTKLWCKQYDRGRLSRESIYDPDTDMLVKETEYYDDGTATVSEFNPIGDPVTITFLLADGTVDMTQTFEYVYDEYDSQLSCKAYVNDALVLHTEYAYAEDGWTYVARETMYNEDGSYTVVLFNEDEELVSETNHDAQGNVIE